MDDAGAKKSGGRHLEFVIEIARAGRWRPLLSATRRPDFDYYTAFRGCRRLRHDPSSPTDPPPPPPPHRGSITSRAPKFSGYSLCVEGPLSNPPLPPPRTSHLRTQLPLSHWPRRDFIVSSAAPLPAPDTSLISRRPRPLLCSHSLTLFGESDACTCCMHVRAYIRRQRLPALTGYELRKLKSRLIVGSALGSVKIAYPYRSRVDAS
jgi:hypothetical protein